MQHSTRIDRLLALRWNRDDVGGLDERLDTLKRSDHAVGLVVSLDGGGWLVANGDSGSSRGVLHRYDRW